ncbi:uncharacterized protein B0T23DRAFT_149406 [Neurospora hispaniola]|uniref:Uncharacterized protein n=1 Tax=Neurospora hispaniola TaxID=588809 RepID=A0AAJ0I8I7_9PEZI|nr:hypothetical protein B0T23DRAFT_149406 [Neurospora hispaniola]
MSNFQIYPNSTLFFFLSLAYVSRHQPICNALRRSATIGLPIANIRSRSLTAHGSMRRICNFRPTRHRGTN